jgi:phosphoribosylformylglycinamidine synthase
MGARPVANLNALRFGSPDHPKTRSLLAGVVKGIGHYGNCVGVPTVGGSCDFDASYNGNCLVNAMTVGIADADKIFYSAAAGLGNPVVYVGSKTGRDGIHGATMASAEFGKDAEEKRPTVQVGDPFTEKLLIEACLELMQTDAIVAIQDMGAAGLTSSSLEMASKGEMGITMWMDKVPCREEGMTTYEMMLSESQERMLMILKPGKEEMAKAIFDKWDLDFAVIGELTDTKRMILTMNGVVEADLPIPPLSDAAPEYDRPHRATPKAEYLEPDLYPAPADYNETILSLLGSENLSSRRWIWQQYDHMVMGDTVQYSGGDAAVVRVHGTQKALAMSVDCTPRYCLTDPIEGGKQAVVETYRNIIASGAKPLAITNCLNFGNPEKPEIMGQIVGCLDGMAQACIALDYPIVSGNVSLYNETMGTGILPTPAIGGVGLMQNVANHKTIAFKAEGETIIVVGETKGHLGSSIYCQKVCGCEKAAPPPVNLVAERAAGELLLLANEIITASHDISDGGLVIALAEMAMASGLGANLPEPDTMLPLHAWLFGEDQGRYIITTDKPKIFLKKAEKAGVLAQEIGVVAGKNLVLSNIIYLPVNDLKVAHESWMPEFMK